MRQVAGHSIAEIARRFGCEVSGDPSVRVTHVASLQEAGPEAVAFVARPKYVSLIGSTRAGAVIVSPEHASKCRTTALITRNPHAVYARVAALLHPAEPAPIGVHESAIVDPSARIDRSASIGPGCVIGRAHIGPRVRLGPHCIVMDDAHIGADTQLVARVTLCESVHVGERCHLHPGAVVGSDGFGNVMENGAWVKVPQLGSVQIGNDVSVGANTTIDRGALGDTVIEDGVRLDNQIQIAHNVRIGAHTAIAACVGIAGSSTVGKRCLIGGKVGIADQVDICDGVTILAMTPVGSSIRTPGVYSGNLGFEEAHRFRRSAVRFRHLDDMARELRRARPSHDAR
jgi:UDP-3-O-[3-hydroxymyristoyl] glucosamine N-acyltransferase